MVALVFDDVVYNGLLISHYIITVFVGKRHKLCRRICFELLYRYNNLSFVYSPIYRHHYAECCSHEIDA